MAAALISVLAVGTGLNTLLRLGSVAAMVPAESGCSMILGGGSIARAAVPGNGARISGAGARRICSVLSADTFQERSSIPCRSAELSGSGIKHASAGWDSAS